MGRGPSPELLAHLIAAINMDSAVFNPDRPLSVAAHPLLHGLFRDVARDVPDPRTGASTFAHWVNLQNLYRQVPGVDGWGEFFDPERELTEPFIFETPYDDATPFFHQLALPASDMYYGADYGMYHSLYENFHWMKTVVDPDFAYHAVMAQIQGRALLRLANADWLPLDLESEARYWRLAYEDLARVAAERGQSVPGLAAARERLELFAAEAHGLGVAAQALLQDAARYGAAADRLPLLNRELAALPRQFHRPAGRPGAAPERNLFSGSSYDQAAVSGSTLPGIRFALDRGETAEAERESALYLEALRARVEALAALRGSVEALP